MNIDPKNPLDYATPVRRAGSLRQRALYCISLPLTVFGLAVSQGAGDRPVGAAIAGVGALLLGFALPLTASGK